MSIEAQTAKVYFAPTKGRRYLTKGSAIHNEARAIIYKHYPREPYESDTGYFCDIGETRPMYFTRKYKALCEALRNTIK
ncbi:MAG TPA: hypothetical protein EYN67_12375 [Flavobacteriales bacterium]|nr:hypothetical protein [Methylococcaceae bacterium]HHZ96318.1 hypothetical protein [Flavobacteriales bacterium]HIO13102.1 hypothetical protein [Methylococcales bacterium]